MKTPPSRCIAISPLEILSHHICKFHYSPTSIELAGIRMFPRFMFGCVPLDKRSGHNRTARLASLMLPKHSAYSNNFCCIMDSETYAFEIWAILS